jgi:glycosyltransferase involved in cell wall biosynthesis
VRAKPVISIIISTYNSPNYLGLVLEGYFSQKYDQPFEIIIADDGSTEDTAHLIDYFRGNREASIVHVWQRDEGFQKCRVLNKAIAKSQGILLLFTDGDCIPQPNMLKIHTSHAKRNYFLTGGYLKLSQKVSRLITAHEVHSGAAFNPLWLIRNGLTPSAKLIKLISGSPFDKVANQFTPTRRTWNGHNASCFRDDALAVNGFNETMQYGGEDVEFGLRLNNAGVQGKHIRFSTIPLHLYHNHSYVNSDMIIKNKAITMQTVSEKTTYASIGVSQWID